MYSVAVGSFSTHVLIFSFLVVWYIEHMKVRMTSERPRACLYFDNVDSKLTLHRINQAFTPLLLTCMIVTLLCHHKMSTAPKMVSLSLVMFIQW